MPEFVDFVTSFAAPIVRAIEHYGPLAVLVFTTIFGSLRAISLSLPSNIRERHEAQDIRNTSDFAQCDTYQPSYYFKVYWRLIEACVARGFYFAAGLINNAPAIIPWVAVFGLCIRDAYDTPRELRERIAAAYRHTDPPLSQLEAMQLEMILRQTMPCAYVYDHDISKQCSSVHSFYSTLQTFAHVTSPSSKPSQSTSSANIIQTAPPTHLQTSSRPNPGSYPHPRPSRFVGLPLELVQKHHQPRRRLKAWSSALFDCIWQSAHRTSVPMLASGDVLIDACGGGPRVPAFAMSPLIFSASFVPRRPRGREQFLNFLTALAVPGLARNGWEGRVASSMRAGREWLVVVREDVDRVCSSDIGLMVRALKAEGFAKACRGMVVEYRIVVGEVLYEDDERREMDKVENMVRRLRETVFLEYRRFKVVVEGLQWLDRTREGRKLISEVAEVVLYMNALGRFSE